MANMSYCRFENTYRDLLDCLVHMDDEDLSADEAKYRNRIIEICKDVAESFNDE